MTTGPGLVALPPRVERAVERVARFVQRAFATPPSNSGVIVLPVPADAKRVIARLHNEDFTDQRLIDLRWNNTRIDRCNFGGATLVNVELNDSTINNTNFQYAALRNVSFQRTVLNGCDFGGADLSTTDLRGADLRYTYGLTPAQFRQARSDEYTLLPAYLAVRVHRTDAAPALASGR